jgi:hypothetical protein
VTIDAESIVDIVGRITANIGFNVLSQSTIVVAGNLKWLVEPDTQETWVPTQDNSSTWTQVTDETVIWH